jgi:hypothetical protein
MLGTSVSLILPGLASATPSLWRRILPRIRILNFEPMRISRWPKSVDTRWYLGVLCFKCRTPILFALDRTEGAGQAVAAGKLVLTCSAPECHHQADYSKAKVSRFQKSQESP